jgi:hypothetical protein
VLHLFIPGLVGPRFVGPAAPLALEQYLADGAAADGAPAMPQDVADLLRDCLHKNPEDRPRGMQEVAGALQAAYRRATGQAYPREEPEPGEGLADSLNNRAVSLFNLDSARFGAEAEQLWDEALRVEPHHLEATYNWGLIQWRSGRMTDLKLLERLREVRTSAADSARVDYLLGLVHLERADAPAAVQLLSKAAEVGTGRAEITSALDLAQSLSAPSEQLPRTFQGHTDRVNSVSWGPDGRFALSGSEDQSALLRTRYGDWGGGGGGWLALRPLPLLLRLSFRRRRRGPKEPLAVPAQGLAPQAFILRLRDEAAVPPILHGGEPLLHAPVRREPEVQGCVRQAEARQKGEARVELEPRGGQGRQGGGRKPRGGVAGEAGDGAGEVTEERHGEGHQGFAA